MNRASASRRSPWRFGVPACACGGAAARSHAHVSGAARSGAAMPRGLVDLVREAQQAVDRMTGERDELATQIDDHHGGSPSRRRGAASRSWTGRRTGGAEPGLDPVRGPGLVVTLNDAKRDAEGRFPRDASPDDLVVHQQDVEAVLNALWSSRGGGHPDAGSTHHRDVGAALRRQHSAAERSDL